MLLSGQKVEFFIDLSLLSLNLYIIYYEMSPPFLLEMHKIHAANLLQFIICKIQSM